jgi:hypothetical protein
MNNGKLLLVSPFILASAIVGFSIVNDNFSSKYQPVATETLGMEKPAEATGAAAYWFNLMKDENGQLNEQRMHDASTQVALQNRHHSPAAWPLMFTELGPDNVGGRTRAICIDRNDHFHMFAGGVCGGIWETHDGGSSWTHNAASDQLDVLTVTTIAQSVDGTWYFGTGEGIFYFFNFDGAGGYLGGGIWKSTDNGGTFTRLASTGPANYTNTNVTWSTVSKIATDPTNANRIYAGTNHGLMISSDAGVSWTLAGAALAGQVYDVDVASDHTVYSVVVNRLWRSPIGDPGSYVMANGSTGYPQSGMGRSEVAISPTDPNYVYVVLGSNTDKLLGAYISIDGGSSYHPIAGPGNLVFEPFGSGSQGQAGYDMAMAVDPSDKTHIILGGVTLWTWKMASSPGAMPITGQWTQIAHQFQFGMGDLQYEHSDNHMIVYDQTTPGKFYIGCDGGIFRSLDNGMTYIPMNKNYRVTQFYDVAPSYTAPSRNVFFGGCQDNGTQFVSGNGNTPMSAFAIGGGDGGQVDVSFLNPSAGFVTVYYGTLYRSANGGNGGGPFYSPRIASKTGLGQAGFANFITPIRLWESLNDPLSQDSVRFIATKQLHSIAPGNGVKVNFVDTLRPSYYGVLQPTATIIPGTLVVSAGNVTLTDDGSGNLIGTGASASTINYANNRLSLHFTTPPASSVLIKCTYDISYNAGVQLTIVSHTNGHKFMAVCPVTLSSQGPNDTLYVKDIVQAKFAVGFSAVNGLFVTRKPLDFAGNPEWIKVAGLNSKPDPFSSGQVQDMKWSMDGNTLYFSNDNGIIYRLDNLGQLKDSVRSDIDKHSSTGDMLNPLSPIRCTEIGYSGGNVITSIDLDPNNQNNLLISTAGYSSGVHVYVCTNALTAPSNNSNMGNFTAVQGNLPSMPVYSCSFDKYNLKHVLVGTDFGVYSTDDITAGSVSWTTQCSLTSTFPHAPAIKIRQSRWDPWNGCTNAGVFYIATHGRGVWKSEVSYLPMGIQNHDAQAAAAAEPAIHIFPNPMSNSGQINFTLNQGGTVKLHVFNMHGQLVKDILLHNMQEGSNTVEFNSSDMDSGTYLMSFESGLQKGVSRFVVVR